MNSLSCSKSALSAQSRTQSVQNGMPTRSMGTIVFFRALIVPHAPVVASRKSWAKRCNTPPAS
ncbi:hypothetical protein PLA107_008905 [Pseudomonas amygdali pv. lachrymans str. M301315]|uniref:Uncharacterized protein n=1 Tax=Pseudomonas amygdali pv. lachrymans str. M301315 TaxID=629260 RepID=A0AAD0LWT0_PSEAV|nr:hypothetical protein B5U27_17045 [Pseudomonas amygdali pv. lachrymans]AXH55414.1 hypothetical protein PLA107_008905 [Pseudomonas amygdali pv. lachrymans str. M301315]PWC99944.1 hypothetical protein CX658_27375 [Pseudomonas amygdali pv. lachrymans]